MKKITKVIPLIVLSSAFTVGCTQKNTDTENKTENLSPIKKVSYNEFYVPEKVRELKEFIESGASKEDIQNKAIELFGSPLDTLDRPIEEEDLDFIETSFYWYLEDNMYLRLSENSYTSYEEVQPYALKLYDLNIYDNSTVYYKYAKTDRSITQNIFEDSYIDIINNIGEGAEGCYDVLNDERFVFIENDTVKLDIKEVDNKVTGYSIKTKQTPNVLNFADVYSNKNLSFEDMIKKYNNDENNIFKIDYNSDEVVYSGYESDIDTQKITFRLNVTEKDVEMHGEEIARLGVSNASDIVFCYEKGQFTRAYYDWL